MDVKVLDKVMKKYGAQILKKGLKPKSRAALYKSIKKGTSGETARLVLGLYQPTPVDTGDIIRSKNYEIVKELSRIFAADFVGDVADLLKKINQTKLIILANMRSVALDPELRQSILEALIPLTGAPKTRKLALKAFARLCRAEEDEGLRSQIKFSKSELELKIQFFARIGFVPQNLTADFDSIICSFDAKTARNALKLTAIEADEQTIPVHQACLEVHPVIALQSYLRVCANCNQWNTPDVFRLFAGVMQHEDADVRLRAIKALADALTSDKTPVQYLSYFALSATDPVESNVAEAKRQLEFAIGYRRGILKNLPAPNPAVTPETALPFLVNLLAHHQNFDEDLPELPTFATYLGFFLAALCAETTDFGRILNIFLNLSLIEDVEDEYTDNMVKLCDLASGIVKDIGGGRDWNFTPDRAFAFSTRYFKPAENRDRWKQLLRQKQTEPPKSPAGKSGLLRAGMSRKKERKSLRPKGESESDEEESGRPKGRSAPVSPKVRSPKVQVSGSATGTPARSNRRKGSPTLLDAAQ
jgi:hypothetical protein